MLDNIFNVSSSVALARSIAERAGIEVIYDEHSTIPKVVGKKIHIGNPGIYTHDVFMEEFHSTIGQVAKANDFFNKVELEGRDNTIKEVLRSLISDHYLSGEYDGRDRQLASGYSRRLPKLQEALPQIAQEDPIAAGLLALGNELRNEWQGFNNLEVPPEVQEIVEKLRPLGPKWMSLETEDDLKSLMKELKEIEDESSGSGEQGSDEDEDGEQGPEDSQSKPSDGEGGPSEEESEGESGDGAEGESEEDDSVSRDNGDSPSEESGEGEAAESGDLDTPDGGTPDQGSADPKSFTRNDVGDILKDAGIIPDGCPPDLEEPYTPNNPVIYQDNRVHSKILSYNKMQVEELLKDFRLTQKVKKYLLTLSQVGWNNGLKSGTLNSNKIHRLYSAQLNEQPRIYKKREKPKLQTDIAISLLIDDSGSMASRGKVFMAAACAVAMSEVLQGIKVPHDILMFTTMDNDIIHSLVKDFSESFVSRDRLLDRLCRDNDRLQENADGEAVLWAAERLMSFKAKERLLIVLSDGQPSFYGAPGSCPRYLRDVVKVIEAAKGIDVLGIGILDDSVSEYYKRYEVLKNLQELEPLFMRLLQSKIVV